MSSSQTRNKRHVNVFSAAACLATASVHGTSHSNQFSLPYSIANSNNHQTDNGIQTSLSAVRNTSPLLNSVGKRFPISIHNLRGGATSPNDDYYEILGVHKTATPIEIKKAYRRKAVQTHPDKTPDGDRTEFDRVSEAYDVLSSEDKRVIYDRFGKAGLEHGGSPGGGLSGSFQEDILRSFFGGSSASPFSSSSPFSNRRRSVHRNIKYQLEVTLEELYKGATKEVSLPIPRRHQHTANASYKKMEVTIPAGSSSGQSVTLPGEIDYIDPNATPGDAIFILVQRPHRVFSRKQADLAMECEISLKESLCGFQRAIVLLDGSEVMVQTNPYDDQINDNSDSDLEEEAEVELGAIDIIRTNDVRVIKGVGMPTQNGGRGDLYLQFKVIMPGEKHSKRTSGFGSLSNRSNLNAKGGSHDMNLHFTRSERRELGRLLDKLDGVSSVLHEYEKTNKEANVVKNENIKILEMAKATDFGKTKAAEVGNDEDEYLDRDDDRDGLHNPFFGSSRQFFSYSSGAGPRNSFFPGNRRNNSYDTGADDNEEVQCQQM